MAANTALTAMASRLGMLCSKTATMQPASLLQLSGVCHPSCSSRHFATKDGDKEGSKRRKARVPMRYGSKLAMRNPEAFRRMQIILGYPEDAPAGSVKRVTISTLQTMKYLMNNPEDPENIKLLEDMLAYQVTSLNRDLLPLLDEAQAALSATKGAAAAARPSGSGVAAAAAAGGGGAAAASGAAGASGGGQKQR